MESNRSLSITFVGGARKVTGSNFLVEAKEGEKTIKVLVDCGLEQGARFCESKNNEPFSYEPSSIDAVFVTHAHADHIGLLPKLIKEGYDKKVYVTEPTADLIPVMLEDSVSLIAREAKQCDEKPPYTKEHLERLLSRMSTVALRSPVKIAPGITAMFYNAGHILGSALVVLDVWGTRLLFTGDLGRTPALLTPDIDVPDGTIDYLITESVYGNRTHEDVEEGTAALKRAIERVQKKKGTLLIPSFSLERTQIILAALDTFFDEGVAPIPVFLDSPLATRVTEIYKKHPTFLRKELEEKLKAHDDPFSFKHLRVTYTKDESKEVDSTQPPKIIIAGAGMSHGGRVRSHEKTYLPDPNSELLLVGYQVPGSLGRRLQDGAKKVVIDKKTVKVRAKVSKTGGFSAHADREGLLNFAEQINPKEAFVVLGEMESASFLAQRISGFLGIKTYVPQRGEKISINL